MAQNTQNPAATAMGEQLMKHGEKLKASEAKAPAPAPASKDAPKTGNVKIKKQVKHRPKAQADGVYLKTLAEGMTLDELGDLIGMSGSGVGSQINNNKITKTVELAAKAIFMERNPPTVKLTAQDIPPEKYMGTVSDGKYTRMLCNLVTIEEAAQTIGLDPVSLRGMLEHDSVPLTVDLACKTIWDKANPEEHEQTTMLVAMVRSEEIPYIERFLSGASVDYRLMQKGD